MVRRLSLVAGLGVAALVGIRALLPWVLADVLARVSSAEFGLPLEVRNVDLGLLRGGLSLEGVVLGEAGSRAEGGAIDPARELLRAERASVDLAWSGLLERRIAIEALELVSPRLRLAREADGRIDPLGHRPGEPEAEAGAEETPAWPLGLERVSLRDASILLREAGDGSPLAELSFEELGLDRLSLDGDRLALGEVRLVAPQLRLAETWLRPDAAPAPEAAPASDPGGGREVAPAYAIERLVVESARAQVVGGSDGLDVGFELEARDVGEEPFPLGLEAESGDGSLAFEGQVGLSPLALRGRLEWRDLALPPLLRLARPAWVGWLESCRASGEAELRLRTAAGDEGPAGLEIAGRAEVADLSFLDPAGAEIAVAWEALGLEGLEVSAPLDLDAAAELAIARVRLRGPRVRWTHPPRALEALAEEPGQGRPPPRVGIGAFELEGGDLVLVDRTTEPASEVRLRDLSGGAGPIRLPGGSVEGIALRGLAPPAAPFSVRGDAGPERTGLRIEVDRLALPPLDPQARRVGYTLEGGEASLETDLELRGDGYDVENALTLHRLEVDTLDADLFRRQFGMSLDLALALLRDPAGDISLAIPIRGRAGGARLALTPIVRDALREALLGALAAPLKVLGGGLSRGREAREVSFEPLVAVPGGAELAEGQDRRLAALAAFLEERPRLGLALQGRVGPADREGAGSGASPGAAPGVATGPPADRTLLELASRRAERARQARSAAGVEPEQLRVDPPGRPGEPGVALDLFAR